MIVVDIVIEITISFRLLLLFFFLFNRNVKEIDHVPVVGDNMREQF